MSDVKEFKELKELIDSFSAYREVLSPLQESLRSIGETYDGIKHDLETLSHTFSGNIASQLDKVHQTLGAQARSGDQLSKKIDDYASSGEKYSKAVAELSHKFDSISSRIDSVYEMENTAKSLILKLDELISDKRSTYNLPQLQRSLDAYNKNIEKITEFINKDIAGVLTDNAQKIDAIKKDNEALTSTVAQQANAIAELTATFKTTNELLKATLEGGAVNEAYLYDLLDKWAAERKVKYKPKD